MRAGRARGVVVEMIVDRLLVELGPEDSAGLAVTVS
jgi:hypothetical protein